MQVSGLQINPLQNPLNWHLAIWGYADEIDTNEQGSINLHPKFQNKNLWGSLLLGLNSNCEATDKK